MGLPARLGRLRSEGWGVHSKLEGHHFPGRSTAAWTDPKDIPARNEESGRVLEVRASSEKRFIAGQWWHRPLIPALRRQRWVGLCEFKASLVYRASLRTAKTTQRNSVSKNKKRKRFLLHLFICGGLRTTS